VANALLTDAHDTSQVTQSLIRLLIERDRAGRAKYGVTLDRTDLSPEDWIQHTMEELLDAAGYLAALKRTATNRQALLSRALTALESSTGYVDAGLLREMREAVGQEWQPTIPNVAVPLTAQAIEEAQ
jgi:hypothetical protein